MFIEGFLMIYHGRPKRTQPNASGRIRNGEMNKTESAYAEHLKASVIAGDCVWWCFEGIGFKLADKCFYYPDFLVMRADGGMEIHEVKGRGANGSYRAEDDAKVKIKVCAEKYPFPLIVVWPKQGGSKNGWEREEI